MTTARVTSHGVDGEGSATWVLRGARNGIVAGLAMAMVMMVLGIVDQGLFAPPYAAFGMVGGWLSWTWR